MAPPPLSPCQSFSHSLLLRLDKSDGQRTRPDPVSQWRLLNSVYLIWSLEMIKKLWTDLNPITVPSPMCLDQLAHKWFCYFHVLFPKLMPKEKKTYVLLNALDKKNSIQWALSTSYVFSTDTRLLSKWDRTPSVGRCGALGSLTSS